MDIVLSFNNNKEIYILPIVPPNIPIDTPVNNQVFESANKGSFILIGHKGLEKISLSSFFPTKPYPFIKNGASSDGWVYVDFLKRMRDGKYPFRIVITTKNGFEVVNSPVVIDSFSYNVDKVGDIVYTLELSEYRFVGV